MAYSSAPKTPATPKGLNTLVVLPWP
jgi:MFS family permease